MKRLLSLAALLLLVGCTGQVHVTSNTGKPLQNAMVVAIGPSTNGTAVKTDANGQATVSVAADTKWLVVSHPNFMEERIPVTGNWPLNVILMPPTK